MKKGSYYLLDVFTKEKYQGNQLAIFPDARWVPPDEMQSIAAELNLSETVFLYPADEDGRFPMRIFTPTMELPVAGHPIVGTGFYISRELDHPTNGNIEICLLPKIGEIKVDVTFADNLPQMTRMRFPKPEFGDVFEDRDQIARLLNLQTSDLLDLPLQVVSCGVPYLIVPVESLEAIRNIQFDLGAWTRDRNVLESFFIYAFTPSGTTAEGDLHGRMFAPQAGMIEDPATGSANGPLAAYCHQYDVKTGPVVSEQGFEMGRPSILHLEALVQNKEIVGVAVGGNCVFVGSGELFID